MIVATEKQKEINESLKQLNQLILSELLERLESSRKECEPENREKINKAQECRLEVILSIFPIISALVDPNSVATERDVIILLHEVEKNLYRTDFHALKRWDYVFSKKEQKTQKKC